MALTSSDLFVVQQGASVYKVTQQQVSDSVLQNVESSHLPIATGTEIGAIMVGDNLDIDPLTGRLSATLPPAIAFKGEVRASEDAPAASPGDAFIVVEAGTFNATWQNQANAVVEVGDLVVYEGTPGHEWDLISGLFGAGVTSVRAADPITVDNSNANSPVIGIHAPDVTNQKDGYMSWQDKDKLDNIQSGADVGTVTEVTASSPLNVTSGTTTPALTIDDATAGAVGVVRLADSTAITAGTSERVVDAAQLKVVTDDIAQIKIDIGNLDIYTFLGDDPIEVGISGDQVTISVKDASKTQKGVIQLGDEAEAIAGTDATKALGLDTAKAVYLPRDFTTLDALP